MDRKTTVTIILVSLFAALTAVGAFIRIPIPPVPITLQTLFALLCGLVLPLPQSFFSILVYLFLGLVGLPIFTTGGGIAAMTGPTGGYLIGLLPAVLAEGLVMRLWRTGSRASFIVASLVGTVCIYIPGLLWLGFSRSLSLAATLASGLYPFIVGDVLKLIVASQVAYATSSRVRLLMTQGGEED